VTRLRPDVVRRTFIAVALLEACTWVGLLAGMYLKYVSETTEAGVWLFGRLHGAAFVIYLLVTVVTARVFRWRWLTTAFALVASIPPLGTIVFEQWARRSGRLEEHPAIRQA
jgi:integral membrane protein